MRNSTINTFEKGLVMDTSPINQPANALKDNLNGTFLTYNGNELSLQNECGNYQLENSALPLNYLPVGMKEYGDILYIVSYNPLNKKVQVGTFPSPQRISASPEEMNEDILSILTQCNDGTYADLIETYQDLKIYYDGTDTYKIFPGDSYQLTEVSTSPYQYEKLHFYIMDSNKKLHDITDSIILDGKEHCATWQVPGFMAAQWVLPEITAFNIKPRYVSVGSYDNECSVDINFQVESEDPLVALAHDNNDLEININSITHD